MIQNRALSRTCRRLPSLALLALGLAAMAPAAQAQGEQDTPAAASKPSAATAPDGMATKPSSVEGVTVNAPRSANEIGVPPAKAAEFAAAAARDKAWRDYRKSMPPLTSDPNDQSKDFPGLQTYAPQ